MASAKKLKSGSWRCLVYDFTEDNGKRHYKSFTADTKKEAEYMAAEYAAKKEGLRRPENLTVNEAITQYINSKENVLSPSTIRMYRIMQRNHFKEIENIMLHKIDNVTLQVWVGNLSTSIGPKTVRNVSGLLSSALDIFHPDFHYKVRLPSPKKQDSYTPSDDDVKKLLTYISKQDNGQELKIAVLLAAFGPMRRGEICALTSEDIHGNIITVSKSMVMDSNRNWKIKQPKTFSSYRNIEFPDFVIKEIDCSLERIITANPEQISSRFRRALKHTGLPHFRFHDLRHYAASIMHAIGVPDQYIMQRGGWATDNVMKTVYRNVIVPESVKQNRKILAHFENMQHEMQHDN